MYWEFNALVVPLVITGFLTLGFATFSWQQRFRGSWAVSFTLLSLAAALWSFGYALEIGAVMLVDKLWWAKFEYLGIALAPVAWFLFALQYAGRSKGLTRLWLGFFTIIPVLTIILVFTNEGHELIWRSAAINESGSFRSLAVTYGPWFWLHSGYSYLLMLSGTIILIQTFSRFGAAFRWQNAILVVGALMPWLANILYISGQNPIPNLDLSPFGFGVSALLFTLAFYRVQLFDIKPVARRVAMDNMSDVLIVADSHYRIVDINPAGQDLFEQTHNELIGQELTTIPGLPPDVLTAIQAQTTSTSEVVLQLKGAKRHFDLLTSVVTNRYGLSSGFVISLRDITQRKLAENELANRNHILETLNALSQEITSVLDLQTVLNAAVKSATSLIGMTSGYINEWDEDRGTLTVIAEYYTPEASLAEQVSDLGVAYHLEDDFDWSAEWMTAPDNRYVTHVNDPDTTAKDREHMLAFGGKTVLEVPLFVKGRPMGSLELWESRQRRDFSGQEIDLVLAIARQIALAMDNAILYERALEVAKIKSRLLAQVNHELRTPLSVILLYAGMIDDGVYGPISEKQRQANSRIIKNSEYLTGLITQLLDQAELESGQTTLRHEPFDPVEMIAKVCAQMSTLAEEKELELAMEIDPDVPQQLIGDAIRLQQILINLVGNAIKYSRQGPIRIGLFRPDEQLWAFKVADNGPGIPPEAQRYIFEPFRQLDSAKVGVTQGTGLGLAIVKQLTELMRGHIQIESQVGSGTTFTIYLPLPEPEKEVV